MKSRWINILVYIIIVILLLTVLTLTVTTSATSFERLHIAQPFTTYESPSFQSQTMGHFSPQYVTVLEDGTDGWVRICTWRGSAWVNVDPPATSAWTDNCVDVLSRMVWGEGRGVSRNEQKLIVWTVINRLEDGRYGTTLVGIVRARGQFHGYSPRFPVIPEIREMVIEVLEAWERGETAKVYPPFARTPNYRYFHGDGRHNWFRENWR